MEKKQRLEKARIQAELREKMSQAKAVIFVDFRGVNVADDTKLRRLCRENKVEYKVIKNTLANRVCVELGWDDLKDVFQGPTAMALSTVDPVAPAKVLRAFTAENTALKIKGGVLEGRRLSEEKIMFLATLPPKEELLAKVAGSIKSPLSSLVMVLNGPLAGFARALNALREKRESGKA
ncbi:MAG TPA: 50S ribosomal protein L10 [Firmicutes bacterium]|uniref:Large ribosomal subunit protein uL10 n=1 Tax=Candidatus Fermentithermobacillus carboniphilus TaxID=3085328 RepID=A0AAT9L9J9_9FIRM|nr:MAG: 50S ribosomal protein L10 [Candidatus Fermentithermobacillus carboniphilus]HHW18417.1 50S ribosomal protein L10 [Candidatus Fermentithermobacillaceae bacterium]